MSRRSQARRLANPRCHRGAAALVSCSRTRASRMSRRWRNFGCLLLPPVASLEPPRRVPLDTRFRGYDRRAYLNAVLFVSCWRSEAIEPALSPAYLNQIWSAWPASIQRSALGSSHDGSGSRARTALRAVDSVPPSPGRLSQNKLGGPPGNRNPSFASQERCAPREPPARGFGDLSAPCAHPCIGTGVRDRTSIT